MKNNGLFSTLFIDLLKEQTTLNDAARGRMATLVQKWQSFDTNNAETLWDSFLKQALSYLSFVPSDSPSAPGVYPLYEDYGFSNCISVLFLVPPGSNIDNTAVGSFYPAKLLAQLEQRKLNWGILTDGAKWRLYSAKTSRPFEDFVELPLDQALESSDEAEYGLFERFFHIDSFLADEAEGSVRQDESLRIYKCRLDQDRDESEKVLDEKVKTPFLAQVDEVLQYICNGFIYDTQKTGEEYTEEERGAIFESAVKLIYRCLFLFYAEARRLLPSDPDKADLYQSHSIQTICNEARKFRWGERQDTDQYDLWKHLKGLVDAVNEGDPEYGIMGYNGGLFDDEEEPFLGQHQLRNDFLSRALYLLAYVEPLGNEPDLEYPIPYEDLEVRHLGELYENILEFTVQLADADRYRRRSKKGVAILLASQTSKHSGDTLIKKGDVYFGESALERKQSGSYYTPESLVHFLNQKTIVAPLTQIFKEEYLPRFQELLEQATARHDIATRRGAAQSAAAHVQQFVEKKVLKFKVCDPAMGSGHFLVDATNQMTRLVVSLLEEIPNIEGTSISISSHPNEWRRQITRHCIYGVDLNPLAVTLAKLSLWLNCFASEHKLTFLDYHIRFGNSLIGLRTLDQLSSIPKRKNDSKKKKEAKVQLAFAFGEFAGVHGKAAQEIERISRIDEDDTDKQKAMLEHALESMSDLRPLADLYTAYLMDSSIQHSDYKDLFERLAKGTSLLDTLNFELPLIEKRVKLYCDSTKFFHWPIEFPDVFSIENKCGFSAVVGNPPWDIVSAQPAEFFSKYDPGFRLLKRTASLRRIESLCNEHKAIARRWQEYKNNFIMINSYLNEPFAYKEGPTGRNNLYHYFLHRSYDIGLPEGRLGIVIPGSFNADKGAYPLRRLLFENCEVMNFFCFSNEKFIFKNVHHAFRFIALTAAKGLKTETIKSCFLTDPREAVSPDILSEKLYQLDQHGLSVSYKMIKTLSPGSLSILEFKRQRDVRLAEHFYSVADCLGSHSEDLNFKFSIEMMSNSDAWRFEVPADVKIPVYAGRCFKQYDQKLLAASESISEGMLRDVYQNINEVCWQKSRLVFRDVTGGTSERTCISTILPVPNACVETARILYPRSQINSTDEQLQAYSIAILNSLPLDYIIRFMVRMHLSQHIMERAPFIREVDNHGSFNFLVARVARLTATTNGFEEFWHNCFIPEWQEPTFWYPDSSCIDDYGPAHEQEIRKRLMAEASQLTPEWEKDYGLHSRLPDRRDTGDRAQLRAEIDAYVALLYGLSRDDFAYILNTFPVLKKKEMKAFGEFMSKRKCLEEYDRIKIVLENSNGDSK
jgi:hypothetical protein